MVLNEESSSHYEELSNPKLEEHIDTIGIEIYNGNA